MEIRPKHPISRFDPLAATPAETKARSQAFEDAWRQAWREVQARLYAFATSSGCRLEATCWHPAEAGVLQDVERFAGEFTYEWVSDGTGARKAGRDTFELPFLVRDYRGFVVERPLALVAFAVFQPNTSNQ